MVQIAKTILPEAANFHVALRKIFGIGRSSAGMCAEAVGVSSEMRVSDVKASYIRQCAQFIQNNYVVGDELKRSIREDILSLINSKSYRGKRHVDGLPMRGQRTQTNAQTSRKFRRHLEYDIK